MKPARYSPNIIRAFFSALLLLGAAGLSSSTARPTAPEANKAPAQVTTPGGRGDLAGIVVGDRSERNSAAAVLAAVTL